MKNSKPRTGHESAALQPGPLADMLGVDLRNAQVAAEKAFSQVSRHKVLPGHFTILMLIRNNPGHKQSTLADAVNLDRSTMVPILDQFERRGWLERRAYAGDRRAYALHLTGSGEAVLRELEKDVRQMEARITRGLGRRGRQQLRDLLRRLQSVL